jgi:hypothetical protein
MIAGEMFLSTIVSVALFVTAVSPVVLIVLLVRDWVRKRLW